MPVRMTERTRGHAVNQLWLEAEDVTGGGELCVCVCSSELQWLPLEGLWVRKHERPEEIDQQDRMSSSLL